MAEVAQERIMYFVDARNLLGGQELYKKMDRTFRFGYEEIIKYLSQRGKIIRGYYYDGAVHRMKRSPEKESFFSNLRKLGVTLRLKEIDEKHPTQKGVDIYLTADMISLAYEDAYDVAVILSGDGDYVALVDLVKSKGKMVWVMSFSTCLSRELSEAADKVILIENHNELKRKRL